MAKFQLLEGRHIQDHPDHPGKPLKEQVFTKGDVFEAFPPDRDLCAEFNVPGFPPKFARVHGDPGQQPAPVVPRGKNLDEMGIEELKRLCEEEEVAFKPGSGKAELIKALRAARQETTPAAGKKDK